MKKCSKCGVEKDLDRFDKYVTGPRAGKIWSSCKDCRKEYLYEWRKKNPDKYKEHYTRARYKYTYGVTKEWFDERAERGCAICGNSSGRMVIDHCHFSGKTRDVLCSNCNTLLGHIENSEKTRKVIDYLYEHKSPVRLTLEDYYETGE